jgi:hypothetical protein
VVLLVSVATLQAQPSWPIACSDGRVDTIIDDFEAPWIYCCKADASIPDPQQSIVSGCHGNALAVTYDLSNPSSGPGWVVLTKPVSSTNLSGYTHLRIAIRGSNPNSHDSVDVKVKDVNNVLYAKTLVSVADLPEWRVIYVDLRELTGLGALDFSAIVQFEIGIVRCVDGCEVFDNPTAPGPPAQHTGTLYLDELALVDLKVGAPHRVLQTGYDRVTPNPGVLTAAAAALLARLSPSGPGIHLIPAWFPESTPNFNSYVQSEALLVFLFEYERTGNVSFRQAAINLATRLISMQIPAGKQQAGAWYTGYGTDGTNLTYPDRAVPKMPVAKCDGAETITENIDACEWVGNVGWILIALGNLQRRGFYTDPAALQQAIDQGANWIIGQPAYRNNPTYPGLISLGIEGNISAYFGLLAARKETQARQLADAIFQFGWDPVERRMKAGGRPEDFATALDVTAAWGVRFLQSIGKGTEALDSQAYAYSILRAESLSTSAYGNVSGLGDIAGPFTVTVEFAAQAAAAGIKDAAAVVQAILPLVNTGAYPGAFPGATDHWFGGPLPPWNTTMAGVSPTAWVYFALYRDPLSELLPRRRSQVISF